MQKSILSLLVATTLLAPALAQNKIHNRIRCEKLQQGATIDLNQTGTVEASIVNVAGGMVWLETADKQGFMVPISQPMWIGDKKAYSGDLASGAKVVVEFPQDQELRVKKLDGEKAWLGTYDGVIHIPTALIDKMDADYYVYTDEDALKKD